MHAAAKRGMGAVRARICTLLRVVRCAHAFARRGMRARSRIGLVRSEAREREEGVRTRSAPWYALGRGGGRERGSCACGGCFRGNPWVSPVTVLLLHVRYTIITNCLTKRNCNLRASRARDNRIPIIRTFLLRTLHFVIFAVQNLA